jgi:predicted dehydrogenase
MRLGVGNVLAYDTADACRVGISRELGIRAVDRLEEAWDWSPNAVLVAVPTNLHIPIALEAARHGCHLFIEKPLSHTLEGVEAVCAEAEDRRLVTMVGCNMRFHPGPALVKQLLEAGTIGRVIAARIQTGSYLPRWRPDQDYRQSYSASMEWGGAILDCIHEIDLALWYLGPGELRAAVHVPAWSLDLKTEGLAEMLLRHESGAISNVHLNYVQREYRRCCQLIGCDGTIDWDFSERRVRLFGPGGETKETYPDPPGWEINHMYLEEMKHFLDALRVYGQTMNPLEGGLASLKIALAARRDGRCG